MTNNINDKEVLTSLISELSEPVPDNNNTTVDILTHKHRQSNNLLNIYDFKQFLKIVDDTEFAIEECSFLYNKLVDAYNLLYEHASLVDSTAKDTRSKIKKETKKIVHYLNEAYQNFCLIEPSKPSLSDLDERNRHFKKTLGRYKDLLENYVNLLLTNQRLNTGLFESQIKILNPTVTPCELDNVIRSALVSDSSIFLQVLIQKGIAQNDKEIRLVTHAVQLIQSDLRHIHMTFLKLSELRNEANIMIERYRRRWPAIVRDKKHMYIIDDDLDLLEQTVVGSNIDLNTLLRRREKRNRMTMSFISIFVIITAISFVVFTALFSNF